MNTPPAYERTRRSLERGRTALESMQLADGGFPLLQRTLQTDWQACGPLFSTLSVVLAAGPLLSESVRGRAVDLVQRSRRSDGLWEFDPTFGIPPDADDTACAMTVLQRYGAARLGAAEAATLRSFWRADGGPFQTWRGDKTWSGRERDDAVVNCNVLLALRTLGAAPSAAEMQAVLNLIRASESGCRYYCSPTTIAYAAARADLPLTTLPKSLTARPATNGGSLPLAQWLSLSNAWDDQAVDFLLSKQASDGSWPTEPWFTGVAKSKPVWGSPAISTALCIEALSAALSAADAEGR
jgi:hypothetical protein